MTAERGSKPGATSRRDWLQGLGAGVAALAAASVGVGCTSTPTLAPAAGVPKPQVFRIGVGSCIHQDLPQAIWPAVLADKPDLFVFGGDTVYASEQPFSLERLQAAYAKQAAVPGFAQLRATVPHMALWDDNDYGLNDGGGDFAFKQESKQAFLQFWNIAADDPRRGRDGVYQAQLFGEPGQRVQVILLDTRWFRSPWKVTDQRNAPGRERYLPDGDASKTMLGEAQWAWLEQQLHEPADLRLIVSGIQILAEGHGWERWGLFPHERQRLVNTLSHSKGVVLVSGDRHFGALYRDSMGMPYPLTELTASGMTHSWTDAKEAGPNRLGELFGGLNYGMVEVDWARSEVRLLLKDLRGRTQRQETLLLADLRPPVRRWPLRTPTPVN